MQVTDLDDNLPVCYFEATLETNEEIIYAHIGIKYNVENGLIMTTFRKDPST